jgi:hypothetical protein
MPAFKAPQYTKVANPRTGTLEPCYIFNIEFNPNDYLSFVADKHSDISLQAVQKTVLDNLKWWNAFIEEFLVASAKFFSKPYTVETINKVTKHTLDGTSGDKYPVNVILVPKNIQIHGGVFTVNWGYTIEPMIIDIPDFEEVKDNSIEISSDLPVSNKSKIVEGMEELNIDELPVGNNSTEDILDLESPAKFYDKQRVKEARLKAKLAVYKAQRQMALYYEKYGDDISDSETDSEYDTSDEENEEEEVQL